MNETANGIHNKPRSGCTGTGSGEKLNLTVDQLVALLLKLGVHISRVLYHKSLLFGLVILSVFIFENFLQFLYYVVLILGGAAGLASIELVERFFEKRPKSFFKALKQDRKEDNYQTFRQSIERTQIEPFILETVYRHIGHEARVPLRLSDHVFKDLRLPRFDYKFDLLPSIAWRCGKTMRAARTNPYYADRHRIEGMVKFLHHQPVRNKRKSFVTLLNKMYLWDDEQREEEIRYREEEKRK